MVLVLIIIFAVAYVYFVYIDKGMALSQAQLDIKDEMGEPEQFAITYLPKGSEDGSEFTRHETWFYPSQKKKVTFLQGKAVNIDDMEIADDVEYWATPYSPEDFDVYTSVRTVKNIVGKNNLAPIELPGFYGDGIATYGSPGAVFVFENEYLTYVETID